MGDPLINDDILKFWPYAHEDLATFESFDKPTRLLVLRLLGRFGPITEDDHAALGMHPNGRMIATWLMTLPPYRNAQRAEEDA